MPHLELNQSMKSNMYKELSPMYTVTHPQKIYMKDYFIAWFPFSIFSKVLPFPSFQMVQNKHKGAAFQTFFLSFPKKDPCQLKRASPFHVDMFSVQIIS